MRPGTGFFVGAAAVLVLPWLALYAQSSRRLAFRDGDLVLVQSYWWGMRERVEGRLEGMRGRWWITYSDGTTEPYGVDVGPFTIPAESVPAASR